MDIGHSVVGEQRVTADSEKKVESFDIFKGAFYQEFGAAVAWYGEKLEDGRGGGRNEHTTHSHYPWEYLHLPPASKARLQIS